MSTGPQDLFNHSDRLDPRILEKSYAEALELTKSICGYLEGEHHARQQKALSDSSPVDISEPVVQYAAESMRMSTCMMQVVSWFMVQKAVDNGEMTPEEASAPENRLGAQEICLASDQEAVDVLPGELKAYLQRSQDLYRRVLRLDQMVYDKPESGNLVHQLQSRLNQDEA